MRASLPSAALGAAAAVLGGLYLDGRYGLGHDIRQMMLDKAFRKRMGGRIAQLGDETTLYRMLELADPEAEALWFEGRSWSYGEIKENVDRLAGVLSRQGVRDGDYVAVFTTNSPEMFITIYALSRLGAVSALINSALRSATLAHCMKVADAGVLITTPDLMQHAHDMFAETGMMMHTICLNTSSFDAGETSSESAFSNTLHINATSLTTSTHLPPQPRPKRSLKDIACLVYTSGTSGKPKAVTIKNILLVVTSTPTSIDISNRSRYYPLRTYASLPLFHGTCLFTGLCYSVGNSATFCLGRRFSASHFSRDLVASGATRMLYVGELCRYLLKAPPSRHDTLHRCIVASGNGLQRDIWERFKTRFAIPEIREFYRSTEGIAKFDNLGVGPVGAGCVGFAGPVGRWREDDTFLVRYDTVTEAPWRDPRTGFCVKARLGEPGEAIGRVRSVDLYLEYLNNPQANAEKLIRDVFKKGDLFQRTGDLLVRDRDGWVRFHDRSGDTFRWQGENVSAGEVREHISRLPNVIDVSVYGVKLEGYDGQAGAAGITLIEASPAHEEAFARTLYKSLRAQGLTIYQMPRLIRFTKQIETGATFKHAKDVLKKRTWNPDSKDHEDSLYWLDGQTYKKLNEQTWSLIVAGKARL